MSDKQSEFDKLWSEAIESHIAGMSNSDFRALTARARPPAEPHDPVTQARSAAEQRQADLAAKTRQLVELPRDENGPRVGGMADTAAAYARPSLPEAETPEPEALRPNRGQGAGGGTPPPTPETTAHKAARLHQLSANQPRGH